MKKNLKIDWKELVQFLLVTPGVQAKSSDKNHLTVLTSVQAKAKPDLIV